MIKIIIFFLIGVGWYEIIVRLPQFIGWILVGGVLAFVIYKIDDLESLKEELQNELEEK